MRKKEEKKEKEKKGKNKKKGGKKGFKFKISKGHFLKIRNFGRSAFAFTMAIPVSPRYPSHYLYSINTCACDLCA